MRVFHGFLFSVLAEAGNGKGESAAQIEGGVVGRLPCGVGPEIELVAGASALETMKDLLLEVDGKAASGSAGRTVQRTGSPLLRTVRRAGLKTQQLQHALHGDGGADGGEVEAGHRRRRTRRE